MIVRVNDISVMKGVLIKGRKKTDFEFKLSFSSLNKKYTFFIYRTAKCVILPFIPPRKTCLCLGASLRWSVSYTVVEAMVLQYQDSFNAMSSISSQNYHLEERETATI